LGGDIIRYWKKTNGDCGTMDNNGHVPDSVEISETEYNSWVEKIPIDKKDHKTEFAKLKSDSERIEFIAKKLDLIE
jgi:hypothetical protein